MPNYLGLYLAALVAGFALIGLSFLIPLPTLSLILFIVGTIIVIVFSLVIVFFALKALFGKASKHY
ncbi:hypothetical protein [Oceanobacillus sp. CAU 1775]